VPVAPVKPKLKVPGTERLTLKYDETLLNFAFNFSLRCYIMEGAEDAKRRAAAAGSGSGAAADAAADAAAAAATAAATESAAAAVRSAEDKALTWEAAKDRSATRASALLVGPDKRCSPCHTSQLKL